MEDWNTLDLYQHSLGELLLALAGKSPPECCRHARPSPADHAVCRTKNKIKLASADGECIKIQKRALLFCRVRGGRTQQSHLLPGSGENRSEHAPAERSEVVGHGTCCGRAPYLSFPWRGPRLLRPGVH